MSTVTTRSKSKGKQVQIETPASDPSESGKEELEQETSDSDEGRSETAVDMADTARTYTEDELQGLLEDARTQAREEFLTELRRTPLGERSGTPAPAPGAGPGGDDPDPDPGRPNPPRIGGWPRRPLARRDDDDEPSSFVSKPDKFDGSWDKYRTWLVSLELYFQGNPQKFPNSTQKILCALSYLTEGTTAEWRTNVSSRLAQTLRSDHCNQKSSRGLG